MLNLIATGKSVSLSGIIAAGWEEPMPHTDPISPGGMHTTDLATYVVKPQIPLCPQGEKCMLLPRMTRYHSRCLSFETQGYVVLATVCFWRRDMRQ